MTYEPIIGLEIHVQTKTKSKMFCSCSADYFGSAPNTHTCPTCLGLPGSLPVPNRKAIDLAIKIALSLNCSISRETKFDRKNYFYPDLPKGYQITQYDQPIGYDGFLYIEVAEMTKKIRIRRVHQEEDTGKSLHSGESTLLDYNKSGLPLVEIVTEPDFRSGAEVAVFAKQLRLILRYLNASDADMEKGQMRIEPNISLRKIGEKGLPPYKVEVKNIGSISVLEKVILKETIRQQGFLQNGENPKQETRGLVNMTGETVSQRSKETEADYRYFPEPDIPPILIDSATIERAKKELPELPYERKMKYINKFALAPATAEIIVQDQHTSNLFDKALGKSNDSGLAQEIAKWLVGDFTALKMKHPNSIVDHKILRDIAEVMFDHKTSRIQAKELLEKSFVTGKLPSTLMKKDHISGPVDEKSLINAAQKVIESNPKAVNDMKKNPNAVMFLVGQLMKELKGQADPQKARKIIEQIVRK